MELEERDDCIYTKLFFICEACGNRTCRPVMDDRPFIVGDIVNYNLPKIPPIEQPVLRCERSNAYAWTIWMKDGSRIGCGLLTLSKGNNGYR